MLWERSRLLPAIAALILLAGTPGLAQVSPLRGGPRVILSFGNDQFIPKAALEATTGARFQSDFSGLRFLDEASVIVLADIGFAQLPPLLQSSLAQWVELGGSLLVTGGSSAFGPGGYAGTPIGAILPLQPIDSDRIGHGFSPTYILSQGHPVFTGVTTTTMANFNDTTLAADASLLLEYRGVSKGGAAGVGLTGSGRPFTTTTVTTQTTATGRTVFASPGSAGTQSTVVVLGSRIGSGVAGTAGVGGQGTVPVVNIAPGTSVSSLPTAPAGAPASPLGVAQSAASPTLGTAYNPVTAGSGGQGGAVGLPTPLQPIAPTPTTTPGVFSNPVTPVGGSLAAGGIGPGGYIATAPVFVNPANPTVAVPANAPGAVQGAMNPATGALVVSTTLGAVPAFGIAETGGLPGQSLTGGQPTPNIDPGFATEGGIQGGGRAAMPLIAERRYGEGVVLAIALDMNATGEWRDRDNLALNAVRYLLDQSKLPKR
jgi:hypothetical protein